MENQTRKKPRILCLHGLRASAKILQTLVIQRWPETILDKLDLDFIDAPFPALGKSPFEGIFDPPYYEWFHSNQDFSKYWRIEEGVAYLEDYMVKHGPYDGLLGFSQGAVLLAALLGMQLQGACLTKVPKIKFAIIISGAEFGRSKYSMPDIFANAFSSPIQCSSLHFLGDKDFQKQDGIVLLESFVDPVVIHHTKGHTISRIDEKGIEIMLSFVEKIQKLPSVKLRDVHKGLSYYSRM